MVPSSHAAVRFAAAVLAVGLATDVGQDGAVVDVGSARTSSFVRLRFAELRDRDGSGGPTAGDEVVVGLRGPLAPKRRVSLEDLPLAGSAARWGDGAALEALAGTSELRVVLGEEPALSVLRTYRPGSRAATPAQIRTATGAVPVLVAEADRRVFAGDRFPDEEGLRPFYGHLHAHTGFSDGHLSPAEAFARARLIGLDFYAVTDHLEQLTDDTWRQGLQAAARAQAPGSFVAFYGYEWGGFPTWRGWMNHVNVMGTDERLGVWRTLGLRRLYEGVLALPGARVVGQFNHPGMRKAGIGRNNWDDFEYHADADLRMKLMMVETLSDNDEDNRAEAGLIPALDRGWHLGPKAEEDNHLANWAWSRRRTGIWAEGLTPDSVLRSLTSMATFYTDDPDASLKLRADGEWLMGSTVYGDGPHRLEVEVRHRTRSAQVTRLEIVGLGGAVVARHEGGRTPLRFECEVDPATDAYFLARVVLERPDDRMISAPIFVDR